MTMTRTTPQAAMFATARARFALTRVREAGRGSMNGPDARDREEVVYRGRELGLWEAVEELMTCDELSCSRRITAGQLDGRECARTRTRHVDGWDEHEAVYLARADGRPLDPRMTVWLYRAAGLAY